MDLNFDLIVGNWRADISYLHLQQLLGWGRSNRVIQRLIDALDGYEMAHLEICESYEDALLNAEAMIGSDPAMVDLEPPCAEHGERIYPVDDVEYLRNIEPEEAEPAKPVRVRDESGRFVKKEEAQELLDTDAQARLRVLVGDKLKSYG
jgi:hypothetical protein